MESDCISEREKVIMKERTKRIKDARTLEMMIFGRARSEDEYYDNMKRGLRLEIRYLQKATLVNPDCFPYAFIACFNRLGEDKKTTLHIWLCGVLPEYRGQGIMKDMFNSCLSEIPKYNTVSNPLCIPDDRGYEFSGIVSVHTYPDFYKEMFAFIKKYGFVEEKELVGKYKDKGRFVRYTTTLEEIRKIMNPAISPSLIKLD